MFRSAALRTRAVEPSGDVYCKPVNKLQSATQMLATLGVTWQMKYLFSVSALLVSNVSIAELGGADKANVAVVRGLRYFDSLHCTDQ